MARAVNIVGDVSNYVLSSTDYSRLQGLLLKEKKRSAVLSTSGRFSLTHMTPLLCQFGWKSFLHQYEFRFKTLTNLQRHIVMSLLL